MKKLCMLVFILFMLTGCGNDKPNYESCNNRDPGDYETIEEYQKAVKDCQEFFKNYNDDWGW